MKNKHLTTATSNKIFQNNLRINYLDGAIHKDYLKRNPEEKLGGKKLIGNSKQQNFSSSLFNRTDSPLKGGKRKCNSVTREQACFSDNKLNTQIKLTQISNNAQSFCFFQNRFESPLIGQKKRCLNKILHDNPQMKKQNFSIKTLYKGNKEFCGDNLSMTAIYKSSSVTSLYRVEKNNINKYKYVNDMFKTNPLKPLSYAEKCKNQKEERTKISNKTAKVSVYLGSNGVKTTIFNQKTNFNDYKKINVIEANPKQINNKYLKYSSSHNFFSLFDSEK